MLGLVSLASAALLCGVLLERGDEGEVGKHRTVVYDGRVYKVGASPEQSRDLWLTPGDLTRVTGFVLKPEGMCRDKLCFPIPKARTSQFIRKQSRGTWFNVSEFARLIRQPAAFDEGQSVWYFGPRSDQQNGYIGSLEAPDFTLPDATGRMHSLSDFKGKKVLLITWASW